MAMNGLLNLAEALDAADGSQNEIHVDSEIAQQAVEPITKMLDFAKQINLPTRGIGNA